METNGALVVELGDQIRQAHTQFSAHGTKLKEIEAPVTTFVLSHKGLTDTQTFGEVNLRQRGGFAQLTKATAQTPLIGGPDRLVHTISPRHQLE